MFFSDESYATGFASSSFFSAAATNMLDIFAGVKTQAAKSGTEKGEQEEAPSLGSATMFVLNISHGEIITAITVNEYRES